MTSLIEKEETKKDNMPNKKFKILLILELEEN